MNFFKKMGIKIKLVLGFISAAVMFVVYLVIKSKMGAKDKLNFELERTRSEIEIVNLEEKTELNVKKTEKLKEDEKVIRKKIALLEETEASGKEVSLEELDKFFSDRGF